MPLAPRTPWVIDLTIGGRFGGAVFLDSGGRRLDRHAATRRLHRLAEAAGIQVTRAHPDMLRHTFVTTMLDAAAALRRADRCLPR
jgi:site-specific recombinase XerD